jgi:hypothetical protein
MNTPAIFTVSSHLSQKAGFSQAALFVAAWMAFGWCFHLDPYAYLLLGIPLCILFQLFVRKKPLSDCWVRDTASVRLDLIGVLIAVVFMIVPVVELVADWPHSDWVFRLYLFACIAGAAGVAFALRRFTANAFRCLLLCLATAGLLGCAWMLLGALAQHHALTLTLARAGFIARQFLLLFPVCFVVEEVAFRGVLDSHIHHPQDSRPWWSAFLLSAMWGWWHLPITPASVFRVCLIAFPHPRDPGRSIFSPVAPQREFGGDDCRSRVGRCCQEHVLALMEQDFSLVITSWRVHLLFDMQRMHSENRPAAQCSFRTTRWSVVRRAVGADDATAPQALAFLCEAYWYPLYSYVRRSGYGPHDAEDLTQGFFARLLEKNVLAAADPGKGHGLFI